MILALCRMICFFYHKTLKVACDTFWNYLNLFERVMHLDLVCLNHIGPKLCTPAQTCPSVTSLKSGFYENKIYVECRKWKKTYLLSKYIDFAFFFFILKSTDFQKKTNHLYLEMLEKQRKISGCTFITDDFSNMLVNCV